MGREMASLPPSDANLGDLLYLNPELSAVHNIRTIEDLLLNYGTFSASMLLSAPPFPSGFDPKVYLAAQTNVSALNRTIRDAMLFEGLHEDAIARRGVYVATLLLPAVFSTSPGRVTTLYIDPTAIAPETLQVGDEVRVVRPRGNSEHGIVTDIDYGTGTVVLSSTVGLRALASFRAPADTSCTLFGIKIYDVERQAKVTFARNNAGAFDNPDDVIVRPEFEPYLYRAVTPTRPASRCPTCTTIIETSGSVATSTE